MSRGWFNEIGEGDCLTKTQDFAKLLNDVLGLRSVRCPYIKSQYVHHDIV